MGARWSIDYQREYFDEFRTTVTKMVGVDGKEFFRKVMKYIAATCKSKGDRGVLFLLDEFKALGETDLSGLLSSINGALDLASPTDDQLDIEKEKSALKKTFFVPKVDSTLDFLAVSGSTSLRQIYWLKAERVDFTKLLQYQTLLKGAVEGKGTLGENWETVLRFCGGHPRMLERALKLYEEDKHLLLSVIFDILRSDDALKGHWSGVTKEVIRPAILREKKLPDDLIQSDENSLRTFSALCFDGVFLNTLADKKIREVPVISPAQLWSLLDRKKNGNSTAQSLNRHAVPAWWEHCRYHL